MNDVKTVTTMNFKLKLKLHNLKRLHWQTASNTWLTIFFTITMMPDFASGFNALFGAILLNENTSELNRFINKHRWEPLDLSIYKGSYNLGRQLVDIVQVLIHERGHYNSDLLVASSNSWKIYESLCTRTRRLCRPLYAMHVTLLLPGLVWCMSRLQDSTLFSNYVVWMFLLVPSAHV